MPGRRLGHMHVSKPADRRQRCTAAGARVGSIGTVMSRHPWRCRLPASPVPVFVGVVLVRLAALRRPNGGRQRTLPVRSGSFAGDDKLRQRGSHRLESDDLSVTSLILLWVRSGRCRSRPGGHRPGAACRWCRPARNSGVGVLDEPDDVHGSGRVVAIARTGAIRRRQQPRRS
jgi:hypothetical protein